MIDIDAQKREITIAVGARIRHYRHMRSFSQEDLALRAGLNPAYFGQVERGLKCPTIDTLFKIAKALEISAAELLRTDMLHDYSEDHMQKMKSILSKIPPDKIEQFLKIAEDISILL